MSNSNGRSLPKEIRQYIDRRIDKKLSEFFRQIFFPELRIYIFPGGKKPERATDGAIGFDFFLRALVDPFDMDLKNPILRKTIFDFKDVPKDPRVESRIKNYPGDKGNELAYELKPGESILGGVGCLIEMPLPMFHWIAPRSGLASKWKVTISNAPGTVDPDYRGEAGVQILNINTETILLTKNMKIAQAIHQYAVIPTYVEVDSYNKLTKTKRGTGGFGSTGIR